MEPNSDTPDIIARLTSRELRVFQMIAHGDTAKGVADKLRIKEWTVGTYLRRIFQCGRSGGDGPSRRGFNRPRVSNFVAPTVQVSDTAARPALERALAQRKRPYFHPSDPTAACDNDRVSGALMELVGKR